MDVARLWPWTQLASGVCFCRNTQDLRRRFWLSEALRAEGGIGSKRLREEKALATLLKLPPQ